jgi:cohesin complex subunit SCC1
MMIGYGGSQDAPAKIQLTPTSQGNKDTLPEDDLTLKSPRNSDAQREPQHTPKSPGVPEFPLFSTVDMPCPIREDDSPFKTVRQTPQSGFGGTGVPEVPSVGIPGQSTPDSDRMVSLFPVSDDYDDQPEIPGLISTPGGISSAGTGTNGLGSMSARTR